jgi:hypothetical protein
MWMRRSSALLLAAVFCGCGFAAARVPAATVRSPAPGAAAIGGIAVHADPDTMRVEETDASIVWGDNWIHDGAYGAWSGGSAEYSVDAGTYAVFTFSGSAVSWIGYRGRHGGIVRVYIDGAFDAELDTYAPEEEIGTVVYSLSGLRRGTHSLMLWLTGLKNAEAVGGETAIDAFDVTR